MFEKPVKKRPKWVAKVMKLVEDEDLLVVDTSFVRDLAQRKLKLRRRANVGGYKICGGDGRKIQTVAEVVAATHKMDEAEADVQTGTKRPADDQSGDCAAAQVAAKIIKLSPAEPGSTILQIDENFPQQRNQRMVVDKDQTVYSVNLVQADVQSGVNKFYKIQLIEHAHVDWVDPASFEAMKQSELKSLAEKCRISTKPPNSTKQKIVPRLAAYMAKKQAFTVFTRWGRVGETDATHEYYHGDPDDDEVYEGDGWRTFNKFKAYEFTKLDKAKKFFFDKYLKQTGTAFEIRETAPCMPGRYGYVALARTVQDNTSKPDNGSRSDEDVAAMVVDQQLSAKCTLSPDLQKFVSTIFDKQMMTKRLQEASINLDKMPIGSL